MRNNNYDRLAPYYDFISQTVYGGALIRAQRSLLMYIEEGMSILIVGGGTGLILEEIEKLGKKNITVTYAEASPAMVALASKRKVSFSVDFLCVYVENMTVTKNWDIVLTPFFFDNFQKEKCFFILEKLDGLLMNGGFFLYVDFRLTKENTKWWKKTILKVMYLFFRIITHIETNYLVDMASILEMRYHKEWSRYSLNNFVYAAAYRKNG